MQVRVANLFIRQHVTGRRKRLFSNSRPSPASQIGKAATGAKANDREQHVTVFRVQFDPVGQRLLTHFDTAISRGSVSQKFKITVAAR